MKKEKKDEYLELLFAQHPDWQGAHPDDTMCLYVVFRTFSGCEGCWRLDDCWAYQVFEVRDNCDELYQLIAWLKKKRTKLKTGRSFDWDLLLEFIVQEKKLEIESYLSDKLVRQIERAGEKKEPVSPHTRMDEDG